MGARPNAIIARVLVIVALPILSSCVNTQTMHPDDILQKTPPTSSIVIFSTLSKDRCLGFCLSENIFHINDDGKPGPIPGEKYGTAYYLGHPHNAADIPTADVNVDWRTLPPGRYVFVLGTFNPNECIWAAPEYYFSVAPGRVLYLGEFHRYGSTLALEGHYSRDLGYFRAHAIAANAVKALTATVTIKNVTYVSIKKHNFSSCRTVFHVSLVDPHGTDAGS